MEEQEQEKTLTLKSLQKMVNTDFESLKTQVANLQRQIEVIIKSLQNRR